jgi:putative redox protein
MVTGVIQQESYKTEIRTEKHQLLADEPVDLGGSDAGMTPVELLAAALIACTNITLRMYANRKEWPVEKITTSVELKQDESGNTLVRSIAIIGALDAKQLDRMLLIANKCPVHKILTQSSTIETSLNSHG